VEIVDQDLLSQIPQKYARIIGGKREEESSRGSTMEVREMLKNTLGILENYWGRSPFYMESQIWPLGVISHLFRRFSVQNSVQPDPKPKIQENSSATFRLISG
jgi:hypothetical protein